MLGDLYNTLSVKLNAFVPKCLFSSTLQLAKMGRHQNGIAGKGPSITSPFSPRSQAYAFRVFISQRTEQRMTFNRTSSYLLPVLPSVALTQAHPGPRGRAACLHLSRAAQRHQHRARQHPGGAQTLI